jgi:hypothetical protein
MDCFVAAHLAMTDEMQFAASLRIGVKYSGLLGARVPLE